MNADSTARRVLEWASSPGSAPPPSGPLRSAAALSSPSAGTVAALGELVRRVAAVDGAGQPPFGDPSPVGAGAILLAAAIGGRAEPGPAALLAHAVRPPRLGSAGWADALARHAVVRPALRHVPQAAAGDDTAEPLLDTLLRASPLTAVLHRPPAAALASGATAGEVAAARALMARPHGVEVLQAAVSEFVADPQVLAWRTELLTRLAVDDPVVVVDTYVMARLRHAPAWDAAVATARRAFSGFTGPDPLSIATLRFWLPLSRIRRSRRALVQQRPLMTGHQEALRLVEGRHRLSIAGAA